jgi:hypothetical protein
MMLSAIINWLFILINTWFGIASFVGAKRFSLPQLTIGGVGFIIISISFIMRSLSLPQPSFWLGIGMLCVFAFTMFYGSALRERGITIRKLLLFNQE